MYRSVVAAAFELLQPVNFSSCQRDESSLSPSQARGHTVLCAALSSPPGKDHPGHETEVTEKGWRTELCSRIQSFVQQAHPPFHPPHATQQRSFLFGGIIKSAFSRLLMNKYVAVRPCDLGLWMSPFSACVARWEEQGEVRGSARLSPGLGGGETCCANNDLGNKWGFSLPGSWSLCLMSVFCSVQSPSD
jgi:hypothetical protein